MVAVRTQAGARNSQVSMTDTPVAGDYLFVAFMIRGTGTYSPPTGAGQSWTVLGTGNVLDADSDNADTISWWAGYRPVMASEITAGAWNLDTFTHGGFNTLNDRGWVAWSVTGFTGGSASCAVADNQTNSAAFAQAVTLPAVTVGRNSAVALWAAGATDNSINDADVAEADLTNGAGGVAGRMAIARGYNAMAYGASSAESVHYSGEHALGLTIVALPVNTAPTAPGAWVTPSGAIRVQFGNTFSLDFGDSTDVDGQPLTYNLEYRLNGGAWTPWLSALPTSDYLASASVVGDFEFRATASDGIATSAYGPTSPVVTIYAGGPRTIVG